MKVKRSKGAPGQCPTPSKPSYQSKRDADLAVKYPKHRIGLDQILTWDRQRSYKCRCGSYHLTSKGEKR